MSLVSRSLILNVPAVDVWSAIGDFQALDSWHPAVQDSSAESKDGAELRHLDLGGGAVIVEKLLGVDGMSYAYEILSGPLPVSDYRSIISVSDTGGSSILTWSATFEPAGDGAEDAIAGVYEAGFGALKDRFGA
ncbi:MAG: SRPBCC family protein [Pseudomonadota bacterium]